MAVAEISVIPLGTKSASVSQYVAQVIKLVHAEKNIKYELSSMGTNIEGDLDDILRLAKKMHESVFSSGVMRVVTTIKIDDRRDKPLTISGKIESVRQKLAK